jgi:hypothetical protein
MLRSICCFLFVVALCITTVFAGEYKNARITKIEGDKITVKVGEEEKTFTLSTSVAITRGDKELKASALTKNLEKSKRGVAADVTTEGEGKAEKVTKIVLKAGGKKKKTDN